MNPATPGQAGAGASPLTDPRVHAVIQRVRAGSRPASQAARLGRRAGGLDPFQFTDYALPVTPGQGDLIYLLCRATGAARAAECATSLGVSALYLAAAIRDNGGGILIGAEIVPAKAERARASLAEAGLARYADIRTGDARDTFADLGGPVDFLLVDGWSAASPPSLGRAIIELAAPQLRPGAIVVNDNGEDDYLAYVRDPANGFLTMSIPLKGSTELSVRC